MKTLKTMKTRCALIGVATLFAANSVFASLGTVTLTEGGGNANSGGLFQAVTSNNGTFDTFCMSIPTAFTPGHTYYYDISSTIVANGVPPAPDYVTWGTAYLYSQFMAGNSSYAGVANANAVQATIWYLQGNLTGGFIDPENNQNLSSLINPILALITADTGKSGGDLTSNGNGAFNVYAMNLFSDPNGVNFAQPQLYMSASVPEPSTIIAGALLLLPFGVSTLRIMRKNKMQ